MTLECFLEKYEQVTRPSVRPVSWKRYRAIIQHFREFLGLEWENLKLQQLRPERFAQYVAWRREGNGAFQAKSGNNGKPAKSKTVNTEINMLATMFNKAIDWGYLSQNPTKSLKRLKEDDRKPFRFLSTEEIGLMRCVADLVEKKAALREIETAVNRFYSEHRDLNAGTCHGSNSIEQGSFQPSRSRSLLDSPVKGYLRNVRLILDFFLSTGARKDELRAMEWSWLDLKRGVVSFRRQANWVPKGTERDIALKPDLLKRLKKLPHVPNQPRVFLDWQDKPIPSRTLERGIQRLLSLSRIPTAGIHTFRHTFASHLAMSGVPLPTIQQLLGHRDIQTVMIYAHLSPSHLHESAKALPF